MCDHGAPRIGGFCAITVHLTAGNRNCGRAAQAPARGRGCPSSPVSAAVPRGRAGWPTRVPEGPVSSVRTPPAPVPYPSQNGRRKSPGRNRAEGDARGQVIEHPAGGGASSDRFEHLGEVESGVSAIERAFAHAHHGEDALGAFHDGTREMGLHGPLRQQTLCLALRASVRRHGPSVCQEVATPGCVHHAGADPSNLRLRGWLRGG